MKWHLIIPSMVALVYITSALYVAISERKSPDGMFIGLRGIRTTMATFPGAMFLGMLTGKFNFRSNIQLGIAILTTAALAFGVANGIVRLAIFLAEMMYG